MSKDKNRILCRLKFFALEPKIYSSLKVWIGLKTRLPTCEPSAANLGVILSPPSLREMKHISQELEWMQVEEHLPESAATGGGRVGTDETTLIERVEPSAVCCSG